MRKMIIFFFIAFYSCQTNAQNIDSLLSIPQTLELSISTPQPRLKEKFQISLDINYVRAHIFRSVLGKIELADQVGSNDNDKMILNVNALQKGENEIGPLNFTINGTSYTTNKISYKVVEPLPKVDKGIWFRKVTTSDSTFCIIIEQRIPTKEVKTNISDKSFNLTSVPEYNTYGKFKDAYSINGLSGINSSSYTDFGNFYDNTGKLKGFMFAYSVYHFTILNKRIKIVITKDKFENLPEYYKFENIVVQ